MGVNFDKPKRWKADILASVDLYNEWFMRFAPKAFRETRIETTKQVADALRLTKNLLSVNVNVLRAHPEVVPMLRMSTCPPIARDRLVGLAGVSKSLVLALDRDQRIPPNMPERTLSEGLDRICKILKQLADPDIFIWLDRTSPPTADETHRASTIVADRLCGSMAAPIIRNAQEQRQLSKIQDWLQQRGYKPLRPDKRASIESMPPGRFAFRMNVPGRQEGRDQSINVPIDAVIMPKAAKKADLPIMIEAKSAGDFTNVNKRRKEEATKITQLRTNYGNKVRYILFLCGYFDSGYLGYEAAEGIDWVWEHRMEDLAQLGI